MDTDRQFKDRIYEQFARIGKAVCSPKRLEILELLCQAPKNVEVLAQQANLSVANASQHLQVLRSAGMVEGHKDGLHVIYRIADSAVCTFIMEMRSLAERQLAEIDRITKAFLTGHCGLEPVNREELLARVRSGKAMVIDVRPRDEFAAGHIAGAVSMPLGELEARLSELPRGKPIVAYCRGPYCVLAVKAVERLRAKNYKAFRLEDGVSEWQARGFPVEPQPAGAVEQGYRRTRPRRLSAAVGAGENNSIFSER
jgi:rhodanese-related sulfurtransferase/predicted transcriptional regulator